VNCSYEKTQIKSPLSSLEIEILKKAKRVEDVFYLESEVKLSTNPECLISFVTDLEIDSRGNLIIADGWQRRGIFIFSPNGNFIKELNRQGQGPGEYLTPVSIEISSRNDIWIVDVLGNKINIYDKNFKFKNSIYFKQGIKYFLHLNNKDEIYMYSGLRNAPNLERSHSIYKYDNMGNIVTSFAPYPKKIKEINFSAVQDGMTIDEDNFIYEMNPLYYEIRKYSPEGNLLIKFSRNTNLFRIITKGNPIILNGPYYLEKGLVIVQLNKHLEIYDTEGNFLVGEIPFPSKILSSKGNSFYTESWEQENSAIYLKNPVITKYTIIRSKH